jgi:hypothetical protein
MILYTAIVSDVATGRVRRFSSLSRAEVARRAERFVPAGRKDEGHRVEIIRRELLELDGAEIDEALGGLTGRELDEVIAELEEVV